MCLKPFGDYDAPPPYLTNFFKRRGLDSPAVGSSARRIETSRLGTAE